MPGGLGHETGAFDVIEAGALSLVTRVQISYTLNNGVISAVGGVSLNKNLFYCDYFAWRLGPECHVKKKLFGMLIS